MSVVLIRIVFDRSSVECGINRHINQRDRKKSTDAIKSSE
jgi:hypothetical protein